jgi:hypothetical protein
MRVLIENYRGWEIYFDTSNEEFYTASNEYDRDEKKRSFASAKKFIDDYIKDNFKFTPIKVQNEGGDLLTLIGVRKDGDFVSMKENGEKDRFSKYYEKDYFVVDERNNEAFKQIDMIDSKIDELRLKRKEYRDALIKETVRDIREKMKSE